MSWVYWPFLSNIGLSKCAKQNRSLQNVQCFNSAIMCTSLDLIKNGEITYSANTSQQLNYGTTAMYSCTEGFFLEGERVRTCSGNGSTVAGVWNGSAPICAGKISCTEKLYFVLCSFSIHWLLFPTVQQSPVLYWLGLRMVISLILRRPVPPWDLWRQLPTAVVLAMDSLEEIE